ncbi:MAG: ATP-grasp domain-containing protein [Bacteroidales bacterium]|nr:ATP-grasp domain-containing protein [Bacteroidales bacterium]
MKNALLLINSLSDQPGNDELDVLVQADAVEKVLRELGHTTRRAFFNLNIEIVKDLIESIDPDVVFNLVETVDGKGSLIHLPASLLESMQIPFTGSGSYALMVTTDKVRTKQMMKLYGLPTPAWFLPADEPGPDPHKQYILKPVWEDGSAGITDASIVDGRRFDFRNFSTDRRTRDRFLEEYIDGREFNITLLAGSHGPEVMPVAEMLYVDYPEDKPKILNYASKWDSGSFEYGKTIRTFDLPEKDRTLVERMKEISLKCWDVFDMRGYMRVDFRVDRENHPWVLEVNANPCIAPDAGFVAACSEGGISYTMLIERILNNAI